MRVGGRHAEDHVAHPHVRVEDASSLRASLRWSTSASGPPSCTARAQGSHRQFLREEGRACMKVGGRYAEDHVAHPCVRVEDASSLRASLRWSTSASGPPSCTAPRAGLAPASPCARRVVLA